MQVPILEFNIVAKSRTIRLFLVAGRQTRPDRKKNIPNPDREGRAGGSQYLH